MENNELIKQFIDKVIANDDTSAEANSAIIKAKTQNIVTRWKREEEWNALAEGVLDGGAIRLNGNDVLINNKPVGQIKYDLDDENGGINFISADGSFSREFNEVTDLFKFLAQKFNVKENKMEDLGVSTEKPKDLDLEKEPKAQTQLPGSGSTDEDGKANADKKGETKGEFNPDEAGAEGQLPRASKLKALLADIKAGKRKVNKTTSEGVENPTPDIEKGEKVPEPKVKNKKVKDLIKKKVEQKEGGE